MTVERALLIAMIIVLAAIDVAPGQDYRYAVFELPGLSEQNQFDAPGGIDSLGNVIGGAAVGASDFHATLWPREGGVIDLGTLGGDDSGAASINEVGEIAGWAGFRPNSGIYVRHACIWRSGKVLDLGTLGGESSYAYDINDFGQVVGNSEFEFGNFAEKACLWENEGIHALPGPVEGESGRAAFDINNLGEIVGWGYGSNREATALLWRDDQVIDLGSLAGQGGQANAINDGGMIIGQSEAFSGTTHAVIWLEGQIMDIHDARFGLRSWTDDIDESGRIVGAIGDSVSSRQGFLLEPGRELSLLKEMIPPRMDTDWRIDRCQINESGQISAAAYPEGNSTHLYALLLSPVNATMTLQGPLPGSAGTTNRLRVSGATPGARVYFCYSRQGGGTRIPGCDLQQNALQLDSPTVIGTAIADGNGVASITRNVPLIARGQTILFQAVVQNECAISQLVVHRFE